MTFWKVVLSSLLTLASCSNQGRPPTAHLQNQPTEAPPATATHQFYETADFYEIRFTGQSQERIRLVYIQVSLPRERPMHCDQATRTCRDFTRPELTLFAVPVTDPHLHLGMGTDICPRLEIVRNGVLQRTFTERAHESFCAYRAFQSPQEMGVVGQPIGR